jgi:hypothetical protein
MRLLSGQLLLAIIAYLPLVEPSFADRSLSFEHKETSLAIRIDGKPLAVYVWQDPNILRPYFAHLHAPNGTQVTRNLPPMAGDANDHSTMHPGLWLGFGDISGADFWRNKGRVEVQFVEQPLASGSTGGFAVRNHYRSIDKSICSELCRIRISVLPSGYLIDWDSRFSGDEDFSFGDQEEMGLGVRMATPLTVKSGGQITNSEGLKNEKQVWGQLSDWCDYGGTTGGRRIGILLMPDPLNFRRSWFHARDYGLLVANPFGANAFTKGPLSKLRVNAGTTFRLRYGVLIHSGPIDFQGTYKDWVTSLKTTN